MLLRGYLSDADEYIASSQANTILPKTKNKWLTIYYQLEIGSHKGKYTIIVVALYIPGTCVFVLRRLSNYILYNTNMLRKNIPRKDLVLLRKKHLT